MKAAVYQNYGGPEVLDVKDVPKPSPGDLEVLIQVKACTVNRTDCANLLGKPLVMRLIVGLLKPTKAIPGTDFAGVIEAIGKKVKNFKVGDKVWGFKDAVLSSQAEYMIIKTGSNIFKMPENSDFITYAASAEAAHYAYYMYNKVQSWKNCKIMVNGGTGGIGSALIQMLKYEGAHVTATCRAEHSDRVLALGADIVIDYTKDDFTKSESQYDFVFDAVGKSSFGQCKGILKSDGVYVSSELGPGNENIYLPFITSLQSGRKVKFPFPIDVKKSLGFVTKLINEEKFKPLIDRSYKLEEIAEAYKYVLSGQKMGNVILDFS